MKRLALVAAVAALAVGGAAVLAAEAPKPDKDGWYQLFNGKDLTGWKASENKGTFRVENGCIVGDSPGIRHNDFLCTKKAFGDFVLRLDVRLRPDSANSGVQFRSERVPDSHEVAGYQADIGGPWWGKLYDEARRRRVLAGPKPGVIARCLKRGGWNTYEIRAAGPRITLKINGTTTVDYTEPEPPEKIARRGRIGLQIHAGGRCSRAARVRCNRRSSSR